jgi:HTH-type transcriptional regulator/antitoxin HigA
MKLHIDNSGLRRLMARDDGHDVSAGVAMSEARLMNDVLESDIELAADFFPMREMIKRGWIEASLQDLKNNAANLLVNFLRPNADAFQHYALCRRTINEAHANLKTHFSIVAWTARVLQQAESNDEAVARYSDGCLSQDVMVEIARYSSLDSGPLDVMDRLADLGISVVIEPHLPGTRLDGIATLSGSGKPVVGLTLRYDRVDSFWFTLLHELSHVALHLKDSDQSFIDDLDSESTDLMERQANKMARDALIPRTVWRRSDAWRLKTPEAVAALADELSIHPAIVAGRIQRETGNYRQLRQFIDGYGVRRLFFKES